jgi:hypothetical protein
VFAYVLSGTIRSENSATGPARVYKAGESFFEPPGSEHLVSENASTTEPASLLAVFVADDGAQLTTFGSKPKGNRGIRISRRADAKRLAFRPVFFHSCREGQELPVRQRVSPLE